MTRRLFGTQLLQAAACLAQTPSFRSEVNLVSVRVRVTGRKAERLYQTACPMIAKRFERGELLFTDVEVTEDILHIVVVVERLGHVQANLGIPARHVLLVLRNERDFALEHGKLGGLKSCGYSV